MTRGRPGRPAGPDWTGRVRRLEEEVAGLRRGQRTRGLIEQAKGRLAERLGIDAEAAFRYLSEQSQRDNVRVRDIVADVAGSDGLSPSLVRLRSALDVAAEPADLVEAVAETGSVQADVIALFAAEADGAIRLVAAHGWPERVVSDWRWIPSAVRTPAAEAIRLREPVWITDPAELTVIGPGHTRVAVPLIADEVVVGAVELVWLAEPDGAVDRPGVLAAAAEIAGRVTPVAVASRPPGRWAEALVDGLAIPVLLLTPVWRDGELEDFVVDHVNAAALRSDLGVRTGRRLLDARPDLLTDGSFDALARAFESTAAPAETVPGLTAARLGTQLVAAWANERSRLAAPGVRVSTMEEVGAFGWGEWAVTGRSLAFSDGLGRILGPLSTADGPSLDALVTAVVDRDRAVLRAAVDRVREGGSVAPVEVAFRHPDGLSRLVWVALMTRPDHRGDPRAVLGLFQDRTEDRLRQDVAASAVERFAAQRVHAAVERAQDERLRATFFPEPWSRRTYGPLRIVARHAAPTGFPGFRGDFYELNELGGRLAVAIGDVFGSGVAAAHTMVRLRHGARLLMAAGLDLPDVLTRLSNDLCADGASPLASLILAALSADGRSVRWGQAGAYSPILVREGHARSLRRPRGDLLGLMSNAGYGCGTAELREGDLLVFFTDGVFQRWSGHGHPVRRLAAECVAAAREGGAEALIQRLQDPAKDEACVVAAEWPTEDG